MAFDPFTWGIGFALTKSATWLDETLYPKTLQSALEAALQDWSKKLPADCYVHPAALLPELDPDADLPGRPGLAALRLKLRSKYIPTALEWEVALVEQWERKCRALGSSGQPLFQADARKAEPLLAKLAADVYRVCVNDEGLFKGTVVTLLDEILRAAGRPSSTNLLANPLEGALNVRLLARTIEAETGACIHAVFFLPVKRELFVWGVFPGHDAKGLKWTFASAARIASTFPGVESLVLGTSLAAELHGTDGAGDVGPLGVVFTRAHLDVLGAAEIPPVAFWESVEAFATKSPNTPFEKRERFPFRHWEETSP